MSGSAPSYILGVDIGTSSVKACLLEPGTGAVAGRQVEETRAGAPSDLGLGPVGSEQDVGRIHGALLACLARLPAGLLAQVARVAVCGQMHGVVLWRAGQGWTEGGVGPAVSPLYTWQDGRCSPAFLGSLPRPRAPVPAISSGHGCATLLWLRANRPCFFDSFDRSGTVMDFLVAMALDLDRPVTSQQNAASFGYFDCVNGTWETALLTEAGLPAGLLPDVVAPGLDAGRLPRPWAGIPAGTPVSAAMGDLQCSVRAVLEHMDTDAVINVSTSAQVAFVRPAGWQESVQEPGPAEPPVVVSLPYLDGRHLAVAASLNGGNVIDTFVQTVESWCSELGSPVPRDRVWTAVLAAAAAEAPPEAAGGLEILPTLLGERHRPGQRGAVTGLGPGVAGLGQVAAALCRGLVANLAGMLGPAELREAGVRRLVGTGAALLRNPALQREVERQFGLPTVFVPEAEACLGAALAVQSVV
jgi:sedoheptulokinase